MGISCPGQVADLITAPVSEFNNVAFTEELPISYPISMLIGFIIFFKICFVILLTQEYNVTYSQFDNKFEIIFTIAKKFGKNSLINTNLLIDDQ
jgi:hypothetical protein